MLRYPRPLRPGDRIGVTAPSSGVQREKWPRVEFAVAWLRERGYDVVLGECLDGTSHLSAPKQARAAELTAMLTDPSIRAVVPPWGGETGIDLLDQLDWDAIGAAEPTWAVGYSDTSTWLLPLTLRAGWATLHGLNLMATPYAPGEGLAHWLDLATATSPVTQRASGFFGHDGYAQWETEPGDVDYVVDGEGTWSTVGGSRVDVTGRLIGGCVETVSITAGTPYGDVAAFGREHAEDGLVVYLDVCEWNAFDICRAVHGLRYAGWFEHARAVLVSRTKAPDARTLTQREALLDALGMLEIPIVLDVECGHVAPYLPLVNGALARVVVDGDRREITQTLC